MPEGDTLYRAARTLQRALGGKQVTRFETRYAQLARIDDDAPLKGRTVESVTAAGKHLLMAFTGDLVLRTHMRMNGSWHLYRHGEKWQRPRERMRVVVETSDFLAVAFDVPVAEFHTARQLAREDDVRLLGPDLLGETFDAQEALRRFRERPALEVALALLNQRVVAGAGNVYKSETLFLARVNPFAPVSTLSDEAVLAVLETARKLMKANIHEDSAEGIVTFRGLRRTTGRSAPAERLWVYGRAGKPCRRCQTPVEYRKQGVDARSTYFCPRCQPL